MNAYLDILSELSFLLVVWAWLRDRRLNTRAFITIDDRNEIVKSILSKEKA
jgi:hypothetical protein